MKIIELPRGRGKTTELVILMMEPGNEDVVYVAPTMQQAQSARKIAEAHGMPRPTLHRFISANGLSDLHNTGTRYVVDELDGVLGYLLGGTPVAVAGTSK